MYGGKPTDAPWWPNGVGVRHAVREDGSITVYWNKAFDSKDGYNVKYNIYYDSTSNHTNTITCLDFDSAERISYVTPQDASSDGYDYKYTITGLSNGAAYCVGVRAVDQDGNEETNRVEYRSGFRTTINPVSGAVKKGESTTATVTVMSINGFNSSVSLTASGLPSGATVSFSPSSGTPTFSSTMTISTSTSTPAGTYTITITGTGGGVTRSCTYTLTVIQSPPKDFSVSVSPSSGSVAQGGSASATVTVTSINGFSDSVSLSVSGWPGYFYFTRSSGVPTFSSTVVFVTRYGSGSYWYTVPKGTYTITIKASGGGLTRTCTYTLTVT
jgi:hypothetical protein